MYSTTERWVGEFLAERDPETREFLIIVLSDLIRKESLEAKKKMFFAMLEIMPQAAESELDSIAFALSGILKEIRDDSEVRSRLESCADELELGVFRARNTKVQRRLDALSREMRDGLTGLLLVA